MPPESPITAIAHVIQLSVAPVFLLTGIGAMLGVLTNRLSRIVDRARVVERRIPEHQESAQAELQALSTRARLVGASIGLCTLTSLLVSTVIALLFLGTFLTFNASLVVAMLFVASMLAFILALLLFLREIFIATAGLRFGRR